MWKTPGQSNDISLNIRFFFGYKIQVRLDSQNKFGGVWFTCRLKTSELPPPEKFTNRFF